MRYHDGYRDRTVTVTVATAPGVTGAAGAVRLSRQVTVDTEGGRITGDTLPDSGVGARKSDPVALTSQCDTQATQAQ